MLEAIAFLSNLGEQDVEWLVANSVRQDVPAGSVIVRHGEPVDHLYLIVDGVFSVTIPPAGRQVARLCAGELAGEMSFVDSRPPSATVAAVAPSRVLALSKAGLTAKLEQDAGFGSRFFKGVSRLLSARLRAAFAVELDLSQDADRTAELDRLARRFDEIHRRIELRTLGKGVHDYLLE